jgi:hypothetical protein
MALIQARSQVQEYYTPGYVDLADLCALLGLNTNKKEIKVACAAVVNALTNNGMVVKSGYKGDSVNNSHGISIYYPTKKISPLYAKLISEEDEMGFFNGIYRA